MKQDVIDFQPEITPKKRNSFLHLVRETDTEQIIELENDDFDGPRQRYKSFEYNNRNNDKNSSLE